MRKQGNSYECFSDIPNVSENTFKKGALFTMKKILAMAAAAALAAGASAYAANPFSDVSASDWAYQAVSDLSDRGLIDGYPDGTFKGQKNITRYEMAQIVARLMAKEDRMDAETRATIDRLASEYGAELQNLGVRVGNLEKKVGNIRLSGDARMRVGETSGGDSLYDSRIRLHVQATVNDTTYVHGCMSSGEVDLRDGGSAEVLMEGFYFHHQLGKLGAKFGRYEFDLGQQLDGWLYGNAFDGIELAAPLGKKVNLSLGYGRMKDAADTIEGVDGVGHSRKTGSTFSKSEVFYAQAKADLRFVKLGLDYFRTGSYEYIDGGTHFDAGRKSVWGVHFLVPVKNFRVFGDYYANAKETLVENTKGRAWQKGKIWTIGLGYGKMDSKKPGSFMLDLAYYKVKAGLYEAGMTSIEVPTCDALFATDGHFWLASGEVAIAKNTYLHGEYAFGTKKEDNAKYNTFDSYADSWILSLNYEF